ncbi:MAG: anthranilate synthase component I [Gammaproteobacteria bacterium]|nr:MAG: anthranilate synthase component I [Gammaproteobacteria bacterium]
MTPEQFAELAHAGYNRIPLVREVLADLDTPLSTYIKLAAKPYSYLLESVEGGEKWGRYSIIGLPCRELVRVSGKRIVHSVNGEIRLDEDCADPLEWIAAFQQQFRAVPLPELPRFTGGLVGYFGYDTVRYIEPRLGECPNEDSLAVPDIMLMVSEEIVVFDNLRGKLYVITHVNPDADGAYAQGQARLDELCQTLRETQPSYRSTGAARRVSEDDFISGFSRKGFESAVRRVKDYIVEGDVMQVVLSQRLSIPFDAAPLDLYRALRSLNPSPYMYFLDLEDFHIVGSSPEILVHLEDEQLTVRPIAGTRPRGDTDEADRALEKELLADPKELAEHLMLIDLGRNDVGRIAETGSVRLTEKMVVERYSHVMHIVSNVVGKLQPEMGPVDALRATFPAGTVSGAPKVRAMEIIDELEPVKRGIYAGAVGYLGWGGTTDTAIAIRTAVIKDGTLHIQAGAGIVADSIPEREWEETMDKGRAIFRAVAMAQAGLDGIGERR